MGNAIYNMQNNPNDGYQEWANYIPSKKLTVDYPYQCIVSYSTEDFDFLFMSANPIYRLDDGLRLSGGYYVYYGNGGFWASTSSGAQITAGIGVIDQYIEANNDVYTDETLTSVLFEQTTPGGNAVWKRVRNSRKKATEFERNKSMRHKSTAWERVNL